MELKHQFDVAVLCVAHHEFKEYNIREFLSNTNRGVVYDVKGFLNRTMIDERL
jgi:UDP-N-acetyl-D-galactosamine dehydrogenase